jgi:hypothetical protein
VSPEEIEKALSTLDLFWGGSGFTFGYDPDLACWWVIERGKLGSLLKAGSPEELNKKLADQEGTGR